MTILVRSLIRGSINEKTNTVDASLSNTTRSVSTTATSELSCGTIIEHQDYSLLLGNEANMFPPQQELQGVMEILQALSPQEHEQIMTKDDDPQMPIRFYRSSKGHVPTAIEQLRQTLHWRREFCAPWLSHTTTTKEDDTFLLLLLRENKTGKIYVRGHDKDGRALVYMRPARENTCNPNDQLKHLVWNLEKAIACTRRESKMRGKKKKELEKIILLIDYEGFSLTNAPPMSTTKAVLHILQNRYPERMYRAFCLHPPFVFRAFWNMVRPFVDPVTKEKIVFVSNKTTLQQQLWSLMRDKDMDLETGAGGKLSPQDFDSVRYCNLPLDQAFPTVV